jgi:hypothetical protein
MLLVLVIYSSGLVEYANKMPSTYCMKVKVKCLLKTNRHAYIDSKPVQHHDLKHQSFQTLTCQPPIYSNIFHSNSILSIFDPCNHQSIKTVSIQSSIHAITNPFKYYPIFNPCNHVSKSPLPSCRSCDALPDVNPSLRPLHAWHVLHGHVRRRGRGQADGGRPEPVHRAAGDHEDQRHQPAPHDHAEAHAQVHRGKCRN